MPYNPENRVPHDGYSLEEIPEGTRLFLNGEWSPRIAELVQSGSIHTLVLNVAHGFRATSLDFIEEWPISRLDILAPLLDFAPVSRLKSVLQSLHIEVYPKHPKADLTLDLSGFTQLKDFGATWKTVENQISNLGAVTDLYVGGYGAEDLSPLSSASRLTRLRMKDRPRLESLEGVEAFGTLRHLSIQGGTKLADISALGGSSTLRSLRVLTLETCRKISTLESLTEGVNLRFLNMGNCGELDSLAPVSGMQNLESLYLYESTNILDGDLSPLLMLPNLIDLRLMNRRHYTPQAPEVNRLLEARSARVAGVIAPEHFPMVDEL